MHHYEIKDLKQLSLPRLILLRFLTGCEHLVHSRTAKLMLLGYLAIAATIAVFKNNFLGFDSYPTLHAIAVCISDFLFCVGFLAFTPLLIALLGTPLGANKMHDDLLRAGIVNHISEAPILLHRRRHKDNPNMMILEFDAAEIPLGKWKDEQAAIEAALNVHIAKIEEGRSKKRILVYAVPAKNALPTLLHWKDEYLSPENFVLLMGEGLLGWVTVNLTVTPHVLIGGGTGSGKSLLLKSLLMQAYRKGADIYIADFKKGLDFCAVWHRKCKMCTTNTEMPDFLAAIVAELERRMECFAQAGCANIDEYNRKTGVNLHRIIFACDEVAELLAKRGLNKEEKEMMARIENSLSTIARLGRAEGIHMILSTQRPSCEVLEGQIKSNIDYRVCGRADKILARIILDNSDAADLVPVDVQGRFVTGDGTVFQAFLIDDTEL